MDMQGNLGRAASRWDEQNKDWKPADRTTVDTVSYLEGATRHILSGQPPPRVSDPEDTSGLGPSRVPVRSPFTTAWTTARYRARYSWGRW